MYVDIGISMIACNSLASKEREREEEEEEEEESERPCNRPGHTVPLKYELLRNDCIHILT